MRALYKLLDIEPAYSTAYHPQTDGSTERFNQEIETYLSIATTNNPTRWSAYIHIYEFTHNNRPHAGRSETPFQLMMGTTPKAIPSDVEPSDNPSADERLDRLQAARNRALFAHKRAKAIMERRTAHLRYPSYNEGDKVWLDNRNLPLLTLSRKLAPKREGPFEIIKKISPVTFKLKLPSSWNIHNVFHANLLTPVHENALYGKHYARPPPELEDDEEHYEVEAIVKHKRIRNKLHFLIKWKGYPSSENTWEPETNIDGVAKMLKTYKKRHKLD
ncbi:hypothetical protein NP233_g306 [Leucocoprinus birnbaumii]|uniref:Uncharacterized protein n=1 Tax=Leucocoprinus birnbaumii TaxID=56174 RepID=A0AAD5Z0D9_9AGAR|nr:hypothetical protein NP233_g306 [Leucocoprinus birnbaumii]